MKRNFFILILFLLFGFTFFYFETKKNQKVPETDPVLKEKFVSLKDGKFYLENKPFFPITLNFVTSLRTNDTLMWPSIYVSYLPDSLLSENRDSCIEELRSTFQLIKDLGFNTVRITHIGEPQIRNFTTGQISITASKGKVHYYPVYLDDDQQYDKYLDAVNELLDAIKSAGLKAIFTVRMFHESEKTEEHLIRLCKRFKDNPTIFAYDLFNEPLYFDSLKHDKKAIYRHTKYWNNLIHTHAPYQLSTIGLACMREIFAWDPNLVNVDFLAMHPYEYEPDQVRNELYWYHTYIKKPWILGETGLPSNNDSVHTYEEQALFARKVFKKIIDCDGQGFAWWQYKDLDWGYYYQNYLGVVNRHGFTKTSTGKMVHGTPKPVTEEVKSFNPGMKKDPCNCPSNFYNLSSNHQFRITGKLIDEKGVGIEGGGILAWDQWWTKSYFTTTYPDGRFELYSDYPFYHYTVSATMRETKLEHLDPASAQKVNNIPTINVGTISLQLVDLN